MNIRSAVRLGLAALFVAAFAVPLSTMACHDEQPPSATEPSAAGHPVVVNLSKPQAAGKFGLSVNNVTEVGNIVVETGVIEWPKAAADPSAAATTGETAIGVIGPGPSAIPISSCAIHPAAGVTASNTAYASISVYKRNYLAGDASTAQYLVAQTTTAITAVDAGVDAATGNWNAWEAVTMPAATGAYLSPGDAITVAIAKTGSGVSIPQLELICYTSYN